MSFKTSIQRELDSFFKATTNSDFNIRQVTKSAFTQARSQLNTYAFERLNEIAVNTFYEEVDYHKWNGFRLLAADGVRLALPNHPTIVKEFGQHSFGPNADSVKSLALCSTLYDVLNHITLDGQIDKYEASERDLLVKHLCKVKKGDLLLLDRGYPCVWLFFLLNAKSIDFCIRMKTNGNDKTVADFVQSADQERVVRLKLSTADKKTLDQISLKDGTQIRDLRMQCRLVKVILSTGEVEVLCSSLLDTEKCPIADFESLYHQRWGVEESYKMLKSRIEIERFSGKTALAIKQDFHAKIFLMTLCAAYAHPIEEKVVKEYKADQDRKFSQKINRTSAISFTQGMLIAVFIKKQFLRAIQAFDDIVSKTREIIRPNRSNPRNHRPKKQHHSNYKPI